MGHKLLKTPSEIGEKMLAEVQKRVGDKVEWIALDAFRVGFKEDNEEILSFITKEFEIKEVK